MSQQTVSGDTDTEDKEWEFLVSSVESDLAAMEDIDTASITPKDFTEYKDTKEVKITCTLKEGSVWTDELKTSVTDHVKNAMEIENVILE